MKYTRTGRQSNKNEKNSRVCVRVEPEILKSDTRTMHKRANETRISASLGGSRKITRLRFLFSVFRIYFRLKFLSSKQARPRGAHVR